jgi:glutamate---cysteine ligase / carboxylate-amine ligase
MASEPSFTLGIEEEYLLVDARTMALTDAPEAMMEAGTTTLPDQVSPEFLRCQVEVGTRKCATIAEARDDLRRLRATIAELADRHGLAPIAASCHPTADWKAQHHTPKKRYDSLHDELGSVADRLLICGMHVHVGIDDDDLRIDLMNQATYFLPHVLALSGSSPFWQGRDTGWDSYRLTVFDDVPRTGLPPVYASWAEYRRTIDLLLDNGLIEDTTKIWWDIRPAQRFPTLEWRICDVSPRLEHALSIAAIIQCLMRYLWRLRVGNLRWRHYDPFLIKENRWRAQRYGTKAELIDFGRGALVPFSDLFAELVTLLEEDAEALGCLDALHGARDILAQGTGAARQRACFATACSEGHDDEAAFVKVTRNLVDEYVADL